MNSLYGVGSLDIRDAVSVRLSSDTMALEVCFGIDAITMPPAVLLGMIQTEIAALGIKIAFSQFDVGSLLRASGPGQWLTLLELDGPSPPLDGRLELLVPVPVAGARHGVVGRRHAVSAGTALARRLPGTAGRATFDLLGRITEPRPPYEARLPKGPHTEISEDGTLLVASCDGEVLLRNLQIEIVPMHVHKGDIASGSTHVRRRLPVFIMGSVLDGARVEADSDLYVQGDVIEAHLQSLEASITVQGSAAGSTSNPCRLLAATSVTCGSMRRTLVSAGTDIRLLAQAMQSTLRANGNVYLPRSMEACLEEVEMHIKGGVQPIIEPDDLIADVPLERQHVRVSSRLRASLAVHSITSLVFRPCTVLDLSAGGALCSIPAKELDPHPGSIVQLKLMLPDYRDQVFAIGRVSRKVGEDTLAISFLQMTQRDQHRLTTYCLQLVLRRFDRKLVSKELRTSE